MSLTQIRANMQKQQQLQELDFHAKKYKTTISHLPIISESNNIEFNIENDETFILSDNENINNDDEVNDNKDFNNIYTQSLTSINDWKNMVSNWLEMIEDELQDQEDEIMDTIDTYNISVDNIEQIQHPAIDLQAKWKLGDIFIENLELSNYFENFIVGEN